MFNRPYYENLLEGDRLLYNSVSYTFYDDEF